MKKNTAALIAATLMLIGCMSTPSTRHLPEWVLHPGTKYSSTRYLTAIGTGDTLRAAESQALNRLAGRFKTRVQANERLSDTSAETFGSEHRFDKTSEYLSDIQLATDATLLNVETLEQHRDAKGRVYVLAALNRFDTARLYEEKIDETARRISSLQNKNPDKLTAYARARQALILGLKNRHLLDQLAIIQSSSAGMVNLPYQLEALRMQAAEATRAIRFNVTMQGNQSTQFGQQISAVMTQRGFSESTAGDLRISGTVTIQEMNFLRDDINTVRYRVLLSVKDAAGKTLITLKKEGRESHLSPEDTLRRAERTVNQLIERELNAQLNARLDSLAGVKS